MARLTAADLQANSDFDKLLVCDYEMARKLEGETWTAYGVGTFWYSFTDGEVHRVEVNGVSYTEAFSAALCDAQGDSFYMDMVNKRLYVHTSDNDSPSTAGKYCVMAFFYVGLANDGVVLQRYNELLGDGKLDIWSNSTTPSFWAKTITGTAAITRESAEVYDSLSAYSAKITVGAAASSAAISCFFNKYNKALVIRPNSKAMIRLKYKCAGSSILKIKVQDFGAGTIWLKSDGTWDTVDTSISLPNSTSWTEYSITFLGYNDVAKTWLRLYILCNINGDECYVDNVEFKRFYEPMLYLPYLSTASIPMIRHSVGSFRDPTEELSFGSLILNDDGYFAQNYTRFIWDGRIAYFYIGRKGATYDELAPMAACLTRSPSLRDGQFSIELTDARAAWKNLLQSTFTAANYPNCEDNYKEKPIPILLGYISRFKPPQQDTANRVYRISQTSFGGNNYALQGINSVLINNNNAGNNDYSTNLTTGILTLLVGNNNDTIECSAESYRWDANNSASFQVWDWLWLMLNKVQGISENSINVKGFLTAKAKRVLLLSEWFSADLSLREVINSILQSTQTFFFIRSNDEYFLRVFESDVPSNALHFYNEDLSNWQAWSDTDEIYASVTASFVHSGYETGSPPGGLTHTIINSQNRPIWERGAKADFPLELLKTIDSEANLVAGRYGDILKQQPEYIRVTLPAPALFLEPTDKVYITKTVKDFDGTVWTIYNDAVFIVMEIEKNLNDATAMIKAIKSNSDFYWEETS